MQNKTLIHVQAMFKKQKKNRMAGSATKQAQHARTTRPLEKPTVTLNVQLLLLSTNVYLLL